ncbi:MAG: hypothetical protein DMD84_18440 [Candidatus Rokuibacteriota bacterium]|nr:MAG: hypothetical protein DMD84_18440 [Candidatus Rokubacteria bacterium]
MRDQIAARVAGTGPQVHHKIGAANGIFVVLHNQHGVAKIPQMLQRTEQPVIVARVESNRRLVQHIKHAAQA